MSGTLSLLCFPGQSTVSMSCGSRAVGGVCVQIRVSVLFVSGTREDIMDGEGGAVGQIHSLSRFIADRKNNKQQELRKRMGDFAG